MNYYYSAVAAALTIALLTTHASSAEELQGSWEGRWIRDGAELKVSMTFARAGDGYKGSFDSEALRVTGIPLGKIEYRPPTIRWEIVGDETTTVFNGELRDGTMQGRFREDKAEGTFGFTRLRKEIKSPQERPAIFHNGAVRLSGSILLPEGAGPFPGVVFLHGSGAEGRWASRYLATRFARRGIAALIYDKRGVADSTGDWRTAGFEDLTQDALAAVALLRQCPEVSPKRVGLHGHSQGATIIPLVASRVQDLAFVVASAGSGVSVEDCEIYSLENSLGIRDLNPADRELAQQFVRAVVATAYRGTPREDLDAIEKKVAGKPWAFSVPPATDWWWAFSRRIARYDSLAYWKQVFAPTLLVYGENDERVPPRRSAARIAEAFLGGKGSELSVRIFEKADHTFRLAPEPSGRFSWPRTAPGYPEAVVDWVSVTCGIRRSDRR
jgi:dienelactone hydrolase